jgi:hypothetical protein
MSNLGRFVRGCTIMSAVALLGIIGCAAVPQEVGFSKNPNGGWVVGAKWDGATIKINGLENALSKAQSKLAAAQQSGNQTHANQWQQIINRILNVKNNTTNQTTQTHYLHDGSYVSESVPDYAAIVRPTMNEAMTAYMTYVDDLVMACEDAIIIGIPPSDLLEVKHDLLFM